MNNMNLEQPTYEELKKANKLDEYLVDLERDQPSRVPADIQHDKECMEDLAAARDFAMLKKESDPRPAFVKELEQKLMKRGVEQETRTPRRSVFRRMLPFSLAATSFAVIVLAVLATGTWTSPQPLVSTGVQFFDPSSPAAQDADKSAMQRTTEKIAENVEFLKQKITDTVPEPSAPPAPTNGEAPLASDETPVASPDVKIASVPSQILDELNGIEDDFLFLESDVNSNTFGQEVALAEFFTDAEAIEF